MGMKQRTARWVAAPALVVSGAFGAWALTDLATAQDSTDGTESTEERPQPFAELFEELVANGTLTADQAQTVQDAISERLGDRPFRQRHRRGHGLGTAAEAIGIEVSDLAAALRDGQTIADVAADNGVDAQVVIDAMVASAVEHIDQAEADGRIDADRSAELQAEASERISSFVNEGPGEDGFRRGRGGRSPFGGPPAEQAPDADATAV